MELFATLEKKQRFTFFNGSDENRFFVSHMGLLSLIPGGKALSRAEKPFDVIRANICIRAIMNKMKLDEAYRSAARPLRVDGALDHDGEVAVRKAVEEAKKGLPFLSHGEDKIFVPILPRSLNLVYDRNIIRLEEKPMKALLEHGYDAMIVDPFDTYGPALFDSYFTRLMKVGEAEGTVAFFDYDSLSIYFVNKQGRLDVAICLFDRGIKKRNLNHMMERIHPVVDAYFRDDREELKNILVQNQLISSSLMYRINSDEHLFNSNLDRETYQ